MASNNSEHGKYIVVEGNDGTGKSTQVELLAKWLKEEKNIDSFVMHEPGGTPMADAIRTVIKNGDLKRSPETNLLLFTASRHELWKRAVRELERGKWVLSARSFYSAEVYQGYAEGMPIHTIHTLTEQFTDAQYMSPDCAFILNIDNTTRAKRIAERGELENKDTFESRNQDFQDRLVNGYQKIAHTYDIPIIDASRSIEVVQQELRVKLKKFF